MSKSLLFLLLSGLFFLSSCRLSSEDKDPFVNVDKAFQLNLFEDLIDKSGIQLHILSTEKQDCENYGIDYRFIKRNSGFDLALYELMAPEVCEEGSEVASAIVPLGKMTKGIYEVEISLQKAVINKGVLVVDNDFLALEMNQFNGILLQNNRLERIPNGSVWGYVGYTAETDLESNLENITERVKSNSQELNLPEGYFGYFSINSQNRMVIQPEEDLVRYETLLLTTTSSASLEGIVDELRRQYGMGLVIKLWDTNGRIY